MQKKCFKAGEKAPDFSLFDHNEKEFKLSDFKGKRVLLSFHPLAWTGVCSEQMKSLENHFNDFEELNTVAIGINVDSIPSKKAWADSLGLKNTRLLSDFWPHGKVSELYHLFREKQGFSERANVIVNEDQEIEFVRIYEIGKLPDINEIITFLREL
ncbi:MAG: redoxin domain-containing protein [Thermoplasmatales archaeon]|nr:MAG: redoxin domain-containing protein [Thermoplasmatales archaeon]